MPFNFDDAVDEIMRRDSSFAPDAYTFMRQALDYAVEEFHKTGEQPHLSAEELYLGFCAYALQEYGPMASAVMEHWGITSSADVGSIVYNLIDAGVFGRQEGDTQEQFNELTPLEVLLDLPYIA